MKAVLTKKDLPLDNIFKKIVHKMTCTCIHPSSICKLLPLIHNINTVPLLLGYLVLKEHNVKICFISGNTSYATLKNFTNTLVRRYLRLFPHLSLRTLGNDLTFFSILISLSLCFYQSTFWVFDNWIFQSGKSEFHEFWNASTCCASMQRSSRNLKMNYRISHSPTFKSFCFEIVIRQITLK